MEKHWSERKFREELASNFKGIRREFRQKDADPIGDDIGLYYKDVTKRKKCKLLPFPNYVKTTKDLIDLFDGSTSNIEFFIQRNHDGQAVRTNSSLVFMIFIKFIDAIAS